MEKALGIFKRLRLPDVIGTPRIGDVSGDWIYELVAAMFGAYDAVNEERLIQEFFLLVPKKNGKSTFAAAMMVTAILCNRRPNAEFSFLAPTIEVAGISFRQARGIIFLLHEEVKQQVFHVQDNIRRITHIKSGAYLQIKAADVDIVTGTKAVGTLIDETHVFATKSKAADIFAEIRGALASRKDGFLIQITTQSKAPPSGVFKSELERAREVRDGKLKLPKPLLPVLYELPERLCKEWPNEKYWPLLNPNLGRSVDPVFLKNELIKAEREGQPAMALFASQHFNVQIGQGMGHNHWAGAEFWEKQGDRKLDLATVLQRSEIVTVGIDGGGLDDLFGLAVLGRDRDTKDWLCWSHSWCHEGVLERRKTIASTLEDFARDGELTIVDDELADIGEIVEIVRSVKEADILAGVAVDPAGIGEFVDALAEIGLTPENKKVVGAPQGFAMMNAIKTAERKLANGTLKHSGQGIMAWAVGNIKIEPTATAVRATKQNAGDAKIDPVMAMFNAVTLMSANPARAPTYEITFV